MIATPLQGNVIPPAVRWCADNGCYGKGYPGDGEWLAWLAERMHAANRCAFATAPDVVGHARETLRRSLPWLPRVRELGYPAALVAQDGLERLPIPWGAFDALFIGGTTEWKLGKSVRGIVADAKARGKYVHFARVNSGRRWRYAENLGCDSADGTFLTFGPDVNLSRARAWRVPALPGVDAQ